MEEESAAPKVPRPDDQGVIVPRLAKPRATYRTKTHTVFESEMDGRNGGQAIALYDQAQDKHQWVVATRGCIQGSSVKWLGTWASYVVALTTSQHSRYSSGDGILLIDTRDATAWAVPYPDTLTEALHENRLRGRLNRHVITLRVGATVARVDLKSISASVEHQRTKASPR